MGSISDSWIWQLKPDIQQLLKPGNSYVRFCLRLLEVHQNTKSI